MSARRTFRATRMPASWQTLATARSSGRVREATAPQVAEAARQADHGRRRVGPQAEEEHPEPCRGDGASPCPAGGSDTSITNEHVRTLLNDEADCTLSRRAAERLARAEVPAPVVAAIRAGRIAALRSRAGPCRWGCAAAASRTHSRARLRVGTASRSHAPSA